MTLRAVSCDGAVLVIGMTDGSLLAYCGAGGAWSEHGVPEPLDLESDVDALRRRHKAECPGVD